MGSSFSEPEFERNYDLIQGWGEGRRSSCSAFTLRHFAQGSTITFLGDLSLNLALSPSFLLLAEGFFEKFFNEDLHEFLQFVLRNPGLFGYIAKVPLDVRSQSDTFPTHPVLQKNQSNFALPFLVHFITSFLVNIWKREGNFKVLWKEFPFLFPLV